MMSSESENRTVGVKSMELEFRSGSRRFQFLKPDWAYDSIAYMYDLVKTRLSEFL